MQALLKALKTNPIIYLTRHLERALGLSLDTPGYFIVTNWSWFAKSAARGRTNVLLIKGKKKLDTRELLAHPQTIKFINRVNPAPALLVFKNTVQVETICAKQGWRLLNPPAALANQVEEKISQIKWLGPLTKYLPPYKIILGKNLCWENKPFIIQFNRAHTGTGTMLVVSEEPLRELKTKFPNREVRVTRFIAGPVFTVNVVVWDKQVLVGNICYQITGLAPFTDNRFATIGNDWALASKLLSSKQNKQIATDVGKRLAKDGWRGLFGIDVVLDEKTKQVYLLEINARQQAGASFESELQRAERGTRNVERLTIFEAHLAALLGLRATRYALCKITTGAQIIQRVPTGSALRVMRSTINKLKKLGFNIIEYDNSSPGEDRLRIQSRAGLMRGHNEFNEVSKKIKDIVYGKSKP